MKVGNSRFHEPTMKPIQRPFVSALETSLKSGASTAFAPGAKLSLPMPPKGSYMLVYLHVFAYTSLKLFLIISVF